MSLAADGSSAWQDISIVGTSVYVATEDSAALEEEEIPCSLPGIGKVSFALLNMGMYDIRE